MLSFLNNLRSWLCGNWSTKDLGLQQREGFSAEVIRLVLSGHSLVGLGRVLNDVKSLDKNSLIPLKPFNMEMSMRRADEALPPKIFSQKLLSGCPGAKALPTILNGS